MQEVMTIKSLSWRKKNLFRILESKHIFWVSLHKENIPIVVVVSSSAITNFIELMNYLVEFYTAVNNFHAKTYYFNVSIEIWLSLTESFRPAEDWFQSHST